MKIILCIFLLNITAVSVFGKELHGILGESIEFPAAVKKGGFLMYGGVTIGGVDSSSFTLPRNENYRYRLQWDSSTGLFSLSGLKMEDIGEYKVQNTDQNIAVFQLNVYKDNVPVSKPHVSVTGDEYPCTVECTAERGTGATLSWYREGEKKPYVSSRVASAPHLHLPAPVERSGTYTCEARNSVSRETSDPLTVGAHCTAVFGQSVPLNGILGQSVEFPAAVKKGGSLMYSDVPIGNVTSGIFRTTRNENYRYRVQWDSSTGFFSLSGLKMVDIGEYKVQNADQNIITVFQLNVYIPVSKPNVSITHNEYPCTIECTAERGTEATLSWYREGQTKPYSRSSVRSAPHLDLPQTVERSGTYTCEAKNSVSNEKASITVGDHCTAPTSSSTIAAIIIAAVALLIVFGVLCYCFIRRRRGFIRRRRGETMLPLPPDAVRSLIQVKKLFDNVDPHEYGDAVQAVPQSAVRTLIQVKKILDNVDPHEYDYIRRRLDVNTLMQVKKLLNTVDLHASGEKRLELSQDGEKRLELSQDAVRSLSQVKELLDDLDPREFD